MNAVFTVGLVLNQENNQIESQPTVGKMQDMLKSLMNEALQILQVVPRLVDGGAGQQPKTMMNNTGISFSTTSTATKVKIPHTYTHTYKSYLYMYIASIGSLTSRESVTNFHEFYIFFQFTDKQRA